MEQRIVTNLWFDTQAEEAAEFYTSVFDNSRITSKSHYPKDSPGAAGTVMTVEFELDGQKHIALNGGPHFKFTEAISLTIECDTQEEVDRYWEKLSEGGAKSDCGWLKDRYGLSWQVTPTILPDLISDKDPAKAKRAMQAMMTMKKLVIADLKKAYDG